MLEYTYHSRVDHKCPWPVLLGLIYHILTIEAKRETERRLALRIVDGHSGRDTVSCSKAVFDGVRRMLELLGSMEICQ
jgi:hypothetical protein